MKYWQHDETGLITTCGYEPSGRWYEIPMVYEDQLPADMSEKEYDRWYALSCVVDGVRVGPTPFPAIPLPQRFAAYPTMPAKGSQARRHTCTYIEGGRHCTGCGALRKGTQ